MIEIKPLRDKAFWRARVNLDGTDFLLDFAWNGRAGAWALTLLTAEEAPLVCGLTVVSNRPLFHRFKYLQGMPEGDLVAVDPSGTIAVPGYNQLGDTADGDGSGGVWLIYFEKRLGEVPRG